MAAKRKASGQKLREKAKELRGKARDLSKEKAKDLAQIREACALARREGKESLIDFRIRAKEEVVIRHAAWKRALELSCERTKRETKRELEQAIQVEKAVTEGLKSVPEKVAVEVVSDALEAVGAPELVPSWETLHKDVKAKTVDEAVQVMIAYGDEAPADVVKARARRKVKRTKNPSPSECTQARKEIRAITANHRALIARVAKMKRDQARDARIQACEVDARNSRNFYDKEIAKLLTEAERLEEQARSQERSHLTPISKADMSDLISTTLHALTPNLAKDWDRLGRETEGDAVARFDQFLALRNEDLPQEPRLEREAMPTTPKRAKQRDEGAERLERERAARERERLQEEERLERERLRLEEERLELERLRLREEEERAGRRSREADQRLSRELGERADRHALEIKQERERQEEEERIKQEQEHERLRREQEEERERERKREAQLRREEEERERASSKTRGSEKDPIANAEAAKKKRDYGDKPPIYVDMEKRIILIDGAGEYVEALVDYDVELLKKFRDLGGKFDPVEGTFFFAPEKKGELIELANGHASVFARTENPCGCSLFA